MAVVTAGIQATADEVCLRCGERRGPRRFDAQGCPVRELDGRGYYFHLWLSYPHLGWL